MTPEASNITFIGLAFTLFCGILLILLPRKYALIPILFTACYMTLGQMVIVAGLHFTILRMLILFGWIRIIVKKEIGSIKLNPVDKVLIAWVIVSSLLYFLLRGGSSEVIVARLGTSYNTIGIYFLLRALVQDFDDIVRAVKILGIIIIPLAAFFAVEYATGRNLFSVFGGVPEFSVIREGRLRCQGPFRHPILAGTFGATAIPLFVGLWAYSNRTRLLAAGALLAATIIVIASSSSGPLLAYLAGMVGLIFWAFRSNMRAIRWGIVVLLLSLHAYMQAPVWFLIARVSDVIGGGGWHRAALIDAAIQHFNEWWLMGTVYTAHWMPTALELNPNMADITNQYISEGVSGGILSMGLFVWLIVKCFKTNGTALHNKTQHSQPERFMIWSLGCTLFSHVVSLFSVTYFDQMIILWYLIISMIAVLTPFQGNLKEVVIGFPGPRPYLSR